MQFIVTNRSILSYFCYLWVWTTCMSRIEHCRTIIILCLGAQGTHPRVCNRLFFFFSINHVGRKAIHYWLPSAHTHTHTEPAGLLALRLVRCCSTHWRGGHNRMDAASLLALKVALWMREPFAMLCCLHERRKSERDRDDVRTGGGFYNIVCARLEFVWIRRASRVSSVICFRNRICRCSISCIICVLH